MRNFLLTGITFLAFTTSAVARTQYCIGGSLDTLSPAQISACKAKSADLRAEAQMQGEPKGWHFLVICDEVGWNDYASLTGYGHAGINKVIQKTDPAARLTVVHGSRIEAGDRHDVSLVVSSVRVAAVPEASKKGDTSRPRMMAIAQVNTKETGGQ